MQTIYRAVVNILETTDYLCDRCGGYYFLYLPSADGYLGGLCLFSLVRLALCMYMSSF
jgi:hypothetical protein